MKIQIIICMENFFARSQEQCTFSTFTVVLSHHVLNLDTAVYMYGTVLLALQYHGRLNCYILMNVAFLIFLLSLSIYSEPRFIYSKKAEVSKRQYSSKANISNVREGG